MPDNGVSPQDPELDDDLFADEDPEEADRSDDDFLDDLDVALADD